MDDYVITETNVWGDYYKVKNPVNILRLHKKNDILHSYPFVDHYKLYSFKPANQRGPAKESQTFILSYAYLYDSFIGDRETEFINQLNSINLRFYKERFIFREKDAYKILIMDTDVDLPSVLRILT